MATRHFNLDELVLIFAGVPLTEFAEGDSIVIELNEDDWIVVQGHHGSVIRAKKPNSVATGTVTIMQGSPANAALQAIADLDLRTGLGAGEFYLEDLNGSDTVIAPTSWITKRPPINKSTEPGGVEWGFTLANVQPKHGQARLA